MKKEEKVELKERFDAKWALQPLSGCWLWTEGVSGSGRPYIRCGGGRKKIAARVAWELYRGPIPQGLFVCHSCDIPTCVNPDHLWLGTPQDNTLDAVSKGRWHNHNLTGEQCSWSKVTAGDVEKIRSSSETQTVLAERFGVSQSAISKIRRRLSWDKVAA